MILCFQTKRHGKSGALAHVAVYVDRSSHGGQNVFYNRKSKSGADDPAERRIFLAFKRIVNAADKFRTDSDAVVFDDKLIDGMIIWKRM